MFYIMFTSLLLIQPPQGTAAQPPQGNPGNTPNQGNLPNPGQLQPAAGNMQNQQGQTNGTTVMADGMYMILAYEKFGQMLPGMTNVKVVIRNNILTFPGDTKMPGKMLQLNFGPGNTICVTPLDGRTPMNNQPGTMPATPNTQAGVPSPFKTDPNRTNQAGGTPPDAATRQAVGTPPLDNKVPVTGNDPARAGQAGAAATDNAIRQASGTPSVNANQGNNNNQGTGTMNPNNGNNTPGSNYTPGTEVGVYVLSNEYFSISIVNRTDYTPITPRPSSNGPGSNTSLPSGNVQPPNDGIKSPQPQGTNGLGLPTQPNLQPPVAGQGGNTGSSQAVLVLRRVAN